MTSIGPYKSIRSIGKGGMGEIFLALDPLFQRQIAIKKIRSDLKEESYRERLLREARITAQMTHPGVITIYNLHDEAGELYYTMPYIEGKTLKELLRTLPAPTIASLLPIYVSICQTIHYAHSQKIIHRDLKPENILVGNFGEVIILDWGLAQLSSATDPLPMETLEESSSSEHSEGLTGRGKIVGTLAYMAPERALGEDATEQSDIYALGVILYQILTLRFPFHRSNVKEFRKNYRLEQLIDPEDVAPYREVPPLLSQIVKRCLAVDTHARYQRVEELLSDLTSYLVGSARWVEQKSLSIQRKKDWELKENILLSKHVAITRGHEMGEWVMLMLSKDSFAENIRLETRLSLGETCSGMGFLFAVPEAPERKHPLDGFFLWLSGDKESPSQLFRNNAPLLEIPDLFLTPQQWQTLFIEKIDNKIHLFLDGISHFTYVNYLPLTGTHVGLLAKELDFEIEEIKVSVSSPTLTLSCLAIPDAFLAVKNYKKALLEYRRIANSFPGYAEGREALFRSGITLIEQGKNSKSSKRSEEFYTLALEEFGKLHTTPAAPLEYLGKSLVYQAEGEPAEEIKCLELALRRYHDHPLIPLIKEQILYRMQESSQKDRRLAYELVLITLRYLPQAFESSDTLHLFSHLTKHWEELYFLEKPLDPTFKGVDFALRLAFWLANSSVYAEIFATIKKSSPLDPLSLGDLLFSLCELGAWKMAVEFIQEIPPESGFEPILQEILAFLKPIFLFHEQGLEAAIECFLKLHKNSSSKRAFRTLVYLLQKAIDLDKEEKVFLLIQSSEWDSDQKILLDSYSIWALLKEERYSEARTLFENYPLETLNHETSLLHPLYASFLAATECEEIALLHLSGVADTLFPRSFALLGHELTNQISEKPWMKTSFLWERRQLYKQLTLFYSCAERAELENFYRKKERGEYLEPI